MAEILPFKGIRYNLSKVGDPALVVSPPYDVISDEERENYYARHPNNVIRLILGKDLPGDTEEENKYMRAARYFQEWMAQQVLLQDEQPSIYIYQQDYQLPYEEKTKSLIGFISLVQMDASPGTIILPHEHTLPSTVTDRIKVIKTCQADLSPVFALYSDKENQIRDLLASERHQQPILDFADPEQIRHQVWKVQDSDKMEALRSKMKDKQLFIADGHHRYEASRRFRDYKRSLDPDPSEFKPYNYVMMRLVATEDRGLTIFPIHRLIRQIKDFNPDQILKKLEQFFHIECFKLDDAEKDAKVGIILAQLRADGGIVHRFVLYAGQDRGYRLTLKDQQTYEQIVDPALPKVLKDLDVNVLQILIFEHILGGKTNGEMHYAREEGKVLELVQTGQYQLAFFLRPTEVSQVVEVATLRRRMPPKSTYFYPKPLTGLIINKL
jgi:uncharacterized protein (DUF1015 family)